MSDLDRAPSPGDVLWLEFGDPIGTEQAGRRPALAVSSRAYNELAGRALVMPISRRKRGWSTEVVIAPGEQVSGVVQTDQVRAVD